MWIFSSLKRISKHKKSFSNLKENWNKFQNSQNFFLRVGLNSQNSFGLECIVESNRKSKVRNENYFLPLALRHFFDLFSLSFLSSINSLYVKNPMKFIASKRSISLLPIHFQRKTTDPDLHFNVISFSISTTFFIIFMNRNYNRANNYLKAR